MAVFALCGLKLQPFQPSSQPSSAPTSQQANVPSPSDVALVNGPFTSALCRASLRQPESMIVPLTLKVKVKEEQVAGEKRSRGVIPA